METSPKEHVERTGASGWWSVKDILSHMAAGEIWSAEVLENMLNGSHIATLDAFKAHGGGTNDVLVRQRSERSADEVLAEYQAAHAKVMELAAQVDPEMYPKNGTMSWYGPDYCLDDFLLYTNYAHKREHSGQIDVFRDRMEAGE